MHNFLGIKLLIDNQILRDTVLIHLLVYRSIVDTKKLQHFVHKIYIANIDLAQISLPKGEKMAPYCLHLSFLIDKYLLEMSKIQPVLPKILNKKLVGFEFFSGLGPGVQFWNFFSSSGQVWVGQKALGWVGFSGTQHITMAPSSVFLTFL